MFHKRKIGLKLGIMDKAENGDLSFKQASYLYYQSHAYLIVIKVGLPKWDTSYHYDEKGSPFYVIGTHGHMLPRLAL